MEKWTNMPINTDLYIIRVTVDPLCLVGPFFVIHCKVFQLRLVYSGGV